jgi:bifunctional DNA-binding transcriptional regulator/antitoxin component of YhaV-PrlF toxin-antitoxin module
MADYATTKLSSKGQVVIPEDVRMTSGSTKATNSWSLVRAML